MFAEMDPPIAMVGHVVAVVILVEAKFYNHPMFSTAAVVE